MKDVLMDVVLPMGGSLLGGILIASTALAGIQKLKDGHVHLFGCSYTKENMEAYLKSFKDDNDGKAAKSKAVDEFTGVGAIGSAVDALAAQKAQGIASTFAGLSQGEKDGVAFGDLSADQQKKVAFADLDADQQKKVAFTDLDADQKKKVAFANLDEDQKKKVTFGDLDADQQGKITLANLPAPEKDKLNGADSLYTKLRTVTSTGNNIAANFDDGAGNKSIAEIADSGKGYDTLGANCKAFVKGVAKNAGYEDSDNGAKTFLAALSAVKA